MIQQPAAVLLLITLSLLVKEALANTCAAATTSALCTAATCDGVWDNSVTTCYDCSLNLSSCETDCQRRWINGACYYKCTNAVNSTQCTACYGYWTGTSCYDCMQDQSTCTDMCNRFWINSKCWDCNSSSASCTDATTCNGQWVTATSTCQVCWTNQAACNSCNRFWDITTSTCIDCQSSQATCETASACNGYWDSGTSTCTLCFLNSANCQGSLCNGTWDNILDVCTNCSNDSRQCTLCNKNWILGKCVDCNSGYNTCTDINYCNGEWNVSTCIICNESQATCETTGAGNCNGNWLTASTKCYKCMNSLTECTKCQLDWIPGVANTCVNCSQSQTYCNNQAICNGDWNSATSTCTVCNSNSAVCSSCSNLRNWDPTVPSSNLCINCYLNSVNCAKCGYFWVPNNANYDSSITGTCVNCGASEELCSKKTMCNGVWSAGSAVCTSQCNRSSSDCSGCGGAWDSTNLLCNVCSKTQAECQLCNNKQWVVGQCLSCKSSSANCVSAACSGIWTAGSPGTCLVCNENSTNCKSCGGFWNNSQCLMCDQSQIICSSCGGIYDFTNSICILTNDKYTCNNTLVSVFEQAYWNKLKCFDCNSSQYVCNKECMNYWENQACSTKSCNYSQYYCESLCFLQWNYYLDRCYHVNIDQHSICYGMNDGVMLNDKCIQCHASQDLCEVQCNQAYSVTGTRVWVNGDCTDCQASSTVCTNTCKMNWITITVSGVSTSVCMKCDSDASSCALCQGSWDSTLNTCTLIQNFCNTSSTVCMNQCAFDPTQQFFYSTALSQCIYCSLNQFTCETACNSLWLPKQQYCEVLTNQDRCQLNNRGYWNSATSICKICSDSAANCALCNSNNVWDTTTQSCLNINLGLSYCTLAGDNFTWITDTISSTYSISLVNGRCLNCSVSSNVCVNACKRSWDSTNNVCLTCSSSQTVCEGSCNLNWILPSTCVKCATSYSVCTNTCGWYWDSSTPTCINCSTSAAVCTDTSTCNGYYSGGTCLLCNASQNNCENKCFFIWSTVSNSCVNCQASQTLCEQSCGYVWDSTLSSNKCILCNTSQPICQATGTNKCNGFWLATNKCTSIKCNQNSSTCINKCLMLWNSKLSLCQKCAQTQYQDASGVCQECVNLTTAASCSTNCAANQFFWDTTKSGTFKCRECTSSEYWNGTACILCSTIDVKCTTCKLVGSVGTCTACSSNYSVIGGTSCKCINDRIPNASAVCTLCSDLITNCSLCSVLGTCDTCVSGYSWVAADSKCRAKYTFTSNTLTGIAFVTDFQVILNYTNAYNPTHQAIVYDGYLYDSYADYSGEFTSFLAQSITKGVLYDTGLSQLVTYTVKLKSGKPVMAPLLILNGEVIPPEDQYIQFTVTQTFMYIDQYTKYVNSVMDYFLPKDYYFKMYVEEFLALYYKNVCSNCVNSVTCLTNRRQCDCTTVTTSSGATKTLYDCSGLDYTDFNIFATTLFSYFMGTAATKAQSLIKVKQLVPHLLTADNDNMTVDIFLYWTTLIPIVISENTPPIGVPDILIYEELIKRTVTYTNKMEINSLATTFSQLIYPHDRIQSAIYLVMGTESTMSLESLLNVRYAAASLTSLSAIITTIDVKALITGSSTTLYNSATAVSTAGTYKVARFFYKLDPFYFGNSTFSTYVNYPYIEYFVQYLSGTTVARKDIEFTFIFNVTEIKSSTKCVQREGNSLQLCKSTEKDSVKLQITCVCTNSATLIEKTILVEANNGNSGGQSYTLYIALGSVLGSALVGFLLFLFFYLKKIKEVDRFIILKKTRTGTRTVDPNMSLDDYDLDGKDL